jgi:hypothetical protein
MMAQSKEALKLSKAEAAARRAIATVIRLRGQHANVARAWAREWVESIIEAPDEWPYDDPDDDDDSGYEPFGEREDQISRDSAMFRDTFNLD